MAKTADNLRIHCVEANPQLLPLIAHHHELNGVAGIQLYNEVVGRADGTASFYLHKDFWASSMTPDPAGERVEIPCRRLLSRLEEWRPDVVVMDIEGAELDLLVEPLPEMVRALVIELHPDIYGLQGVKAIMDTLSAGGFALVPKASERGVLSFRRL